MSRHSEVPITFWNLHTYQHFLLLDLSDKGIFHNQYSTFLTDAMNRLTCFLFLATIVYVVEGYSSGAPDTACGDMFPAGHNTLAQTSKSPYILDMKIEKNKDGTTGEYEY